jgi:hypothetical protein
MLFLGFRWGFAVPEKCKFFFWLGLIKRKINRVVVVSREFFDDLDIYSSQSAPFSGVAAIIQLKRVG